MEHVIIISPCVDEFVCAIYVSSYDSLLGSCKLIHSESTSAAIVIHECECKCSCPLQDGFFDLANGFCRPCACNIAGSESQVCDQDSPVAQCPCRPNIDSSTCTAPLPGFFFRAVDEIRFEAEEAEFSQV